MRKRRKWKMEKGTENQVKGKKRKEKVVEV